MLSFLINNNDVYSTWEITVEDSYSKGNNSWDVDGLVPSMYATGYDQYLQGGPATASQVNIFALQYSEGMDTLLEVVTLNIASAFLENVVPLNPQYYPNQRPYGMLGFGGGSDNHDKKKGGLNGWQIALIVASVLLVVGLAVGVGAFVLRRRRQRQHYVEL